jgi:hypothetical protein
MGDPASLDAFQSSTGIADPLGMKLGLTML